MMTLERQIRSMLDHTGHGDEFDKAVQHMEEEKVCSALATTKCTMWMGKVVLATVTDHWSLLAQIFVSITSQELPALLQH
jgi:hypothetical protein